MNREIKFRAWYKNYDEPNGKMFYSVMPCDPSFKEWLIAFDEDDCFDGDFKVGEDIEIMQFTGLKDKNGKSELYEGDIVSLVGNKIGNIYENEDLLKEETNLIIEGMGTKKWFSTEQEANKRGCKYAE